MVNTFTVGNVTLVDTLGPTLSADVDHVLYRRDPTIDFIYKINSALVNNLDSIQLYNGYFTLRELGFINDSLSRYHVESYTRTDWKKARSKVKQYTFEAISVNDLVIRFDYLDGYTVYKLESQMMDVSGSTTSKDLTKTHQLIDSLVDRKPQLQ